MGAECGFDHPQGCDDEDPSAKCSGSYVVRYTLAPTSGTAVAPIKAVSACRLSCLSVRHDIFPQRLPHSFLLFKLKPFLKAEACFQS